MEWPIVEGLTNQGRSLIAMRGIMLQVVSKNGFKQYKSHANTSPARKDDLIYMNIHELGFTFTKAFFFGSNSSGGYQTRPKLWILKENQREIPARVWGQLILLYMMNPYIGKIQIPFTKHVSSHIHIVIYIYIYVYTYIYMYIYMYIQNILV